MFSFKEWRLCLYYTFVLFDEFHEGVSVDTFMTLHKSGRCKHKQLNNKHFKSFCFFLLMPCFQIWLFCHGSVICFTDGMIFLRFLSIQICFPVGLFIFCSNSKWPGKANCFHLRNTGSTPLKSFQGGNAAFGG